MIIRFLPDSWSDALLRPLSMAASNAGIYVEIMAPDWRFAAALLLGAIVLVARRRRTVTSPSGVLALWLLVAFAVWVLTSGNGRYFIPGLLMVGVLCIALIARLPGTSEFRLVLGAGLVALQGWVLYNAGPWGWWGLGTWDEAPFFAVDVDELAKSEPATYVTISNISYSLIAPQFHPASRWVNISSIPDVSAPSNDGRRLARLLQQSRIIKMVVPSRPDYMTAEALPSSELREVMNEMLGKQRLRLAEPLKCRLLQSRGLAGVGAKNKELPPSLLAKVGFWVCDLQYPAPARIAQQPQNQAVNKIFDLIEQQCPRYYEPGQTSAARVDGGWVRVYPQADIRLYVMDDGDVYYKYWRALNPVLLGRVVDIRAGARVPCESVRGRTGLPWEREI